MRRRTLWSLSEAPHSETETKRGECGTFGANGVDGGGWQAEITLTSEDDLEVAVALGVAVGDARACTRPETYANATMLSLAADEGQATLPVTLPSQNGFVLACAAIPGREQQAARFVFVIDTVPPASAPTLSVTDLGEGGLMVDPLFHPPEISDIHMLFGPVDATDCSDRDAYIPYRRQPTFIEAADLPVRFCAVGFDRAGNESPVRDEVPTGPAR